MTLDHEQNAINAHNRQKCHIKEIVRMENIETESKKKVYFTAISVSYLSTRLQPRSLVASSKQLPAPFVEFDPQRDGIAYFALDADDRRRELQGSDWPGGR